jgi:hypothetical protein
LQVRLNRTQLTLHVFSINNHAKNKFDSQSQLNHVRHPTMPRTPYRKRLIRSHAVTTYLQNERAAYDAAFDDDVEDLDQDIVLLQSQSTLLTLFLLTRARYLIPREPVPKAGFLHLALLGGKSILENRNSE